MVFNVVGCQPRYESPAAWNGFDHTACGEFDERLPDRQPADAELPGNLILIDLRTGFQATGDDAFTDVFRGELFEALGCRPTAWGAIEAHGATLVVCGVDIGTDHVDAPS